MNRKIVFIIFFLLSGLVFSQNIDDEIKKLKEQVNQLLERIEKLEKEKKKEEVQFVSLSTKDSKLSLKGRFFGGYFDSEKTDYKNGSFEVPEAKIQFTWKPHEKIEIVNRMNLNNAKFNGLDYFYIQINQIFPRDEKSRLRIGKTKVNFGEETWWNNPVEHKFITNSASNVSGYDEGIEIFGNFIPDKFGYSFGIYNGNSGTISDNNSEKAYTGKIFLKPIKEIYLSASYYNSNELGDKDSDIKIGGIRKAPSSSTEWKRNIWELDFKLNFKKSELFACYGNFEDDGNLGDREGNYWFIYCVYDITPKLYFGARYSVLKLDDGKLDDFNGLTGINEYVRQSLVCGYRINRNVTLKGEYSWNKGRKPGEELNDNQFVIGMAILY